MPLRAQWRRWYGPIADDLTDGGASSRGSNAVGVAIAALLGVLLITTVWRTGAVPQMVFGHDVMVLLDGGWKWRWGYTPHEDFYSPFGALTFLLIALGIEISGSLVQAIPAATCIVAVFALPLAIYATFTRLPALIALAATMVIVATAVAPHELRFGAEVWSYAAIYNRWAYSLFAVVMLIAAVRPARPAPWNDLADGVVAGTCIALLVFLKISYGLFAGFAFLGFLPIRPRGRDYWLGTIIGGLAFLVLFGFLLEWGFMPLREDMRIAARARGGLGVRALGYWALTMRYDVLAIAGLAAIWCATGVMAGRASLVPRAIEAGWLAAGFVGFTAAILMTNSPLGSLSESPVASLGALVLLAAVLADFRAARMSTGNPGWRRGLIAAAVCLAAFVVLPDTGRNIAGVVAAARHESSGASLSRAETFGAGPLRGLEISDFGGDPPLPTTYVGKVMDGVALLARTGNADRPVAALDFANPFNVARGVRPSRTAPPAWQLGFLFTAESAPPRKRVFNGRDVIMWPKQFGDGDQQNLAVLRQHYGAYLDANYVLAGTSRQWQVFVPRRLPSFGGRDLEAPTRSPRDTAK